MAENSARDRALTEFLAERVILPGSEYRLCKPLDETGVCMTAYGGYRTFDPLDRIADAMECLEAWRKGNVYNGEMLWRNQSDDNYFCQLDTEISNWPHVSADSYSRAICEALGKALGFKEVTDDQ